MSPEFVPEFVTIVQMSRLLKLSRSRFYQLLEANIFLKPVSLLSNKRPGYTREMALTNLEVRKMNKGVNGQVVMFYTTRASAPIRRDKAVKPKQSDTPSTKDDHRELLESLEGLGLAGLTVTTVKDALASCFPAGTAGVSEEQVLADVFRYLKRKK